MFDRSMHQFQLTDLMVVTKGKRTMMTSSNELDRHSYDSVVTEEEQDMANCLILLSQDRTSATNKRKPLMGAFECKTCNTTFPSFQALGGHRTTHLIKPQQLIYSVSPISQQPASSSTTINKSNVRAVMISSKKVHQCSICGFHFFSGQALGGHMRRHRAIPTPNWSNSAAISSHTIDHRQSSSTEVEAARWSLLPALDLNLPALDDAEMSHQCPEEDHPMFHPAHSLEMGCLY